MGTYFRYAEPSVRTKDWGIAVLRVVIGVTFLMHGWQKLFIMGIPGVTDFFGMIGAPAPALTAPAVSILELVGGALLLVGLGTRLVAALLALDMLGAILLAHLPSGFFAPDGFELPLLLLGGGVALVLAGPGAFALDHLIARPAASAAPASRQRDTVTASR